jgi:hypothetical protein
MAVVIQDIRVEIGTVGPGNGSGSRLDRDLAESYRVGPTWSAMSCRRTSPNHSKKSRKSRVSFSAGERLSP